MAATNVSHWRALGRLVRVDSARYFFLTVLLVGGAALPLAGPLLVRLIIDRAGTGTATSADIAVPAAGFLAIAVLTQISQVIVAAFATTTAWRTANRLRISLSRHVLSLDHDFHRSHTPGELIQRVDGDVTSVSDFLSRVLLKAGGALLLLAGMTGVLFVLDWRLGVGFVLFLVLLAILIAILRNRAVNEAVEEMSASASLYGGIEERLTASEDLRSNGAGEYASWMFIEDSRVAYESQVKLEKAFIKLWWVLSGTIAAGLVAALVASTFLLERQAMTLGTTFLLLQYSLVLRRPMEEIVDQLDVVQKANGAMVRVAELMAISPQIRDDGTRRPDPGPLSVGFEAVSFDYGDAEPVLRDVSLEIGAARSVGIVGRTGSGKTTLSRLVLRLVEPSVGVVRLGNIALSDIPLVELRSRVAMIPQEVQILKGSVRDNVTLFDHSIPDADVESALTQVGLESLVEVGIHSEIGGQGVGLSAGESQLLALARVWLRDPDLVVLDEATSRVDPETELRLERAIGELLQGRTALVIAHRLSTLRAVDEILVVEDGRIIEHGDRAELEQAGDSEYRRLLELSLEATP